MSGGVMPTSPVYASKGFSSTPLKYTRNNERDLNISISVGALSGSDVLSEDDTYSLLSPIYHDSFDSDEDLESEAQQHPQRADTSPTLSETPRRASSPVRCELPKAQSGTTVESAASPRLNAWEEHLLQGEREQQERKQEHKKIVVDLKIQEWMRTKREQEKQEKELKQNAEEEKTEKERAKQREIQRRAQGKYKEWLQRKNQEKLEKEKKDKEEAVRKEEQERERRQTADECFQEWLVTSSVKARASPNSQSPFHPKSPYDKGYPPPSFYNPVPWKPIHTPPLEAPPTKSLSQKRPKSQPKKCQSSTSSTRSRLWNSASGTRLLPRR
ncbi:hypothetical protein NHX12_002234 [Muraenolepis orangiensis]|uniref:Coiled-coil domain-containing protein n=1 Tax=Muraenolepis orangiensis TaxID=630683 RepID=A0A9Q0DZ44_9TELE|nr:hypothetical protein NHX12_002234 [Muraenolepis orangiensis]